MNKPTITQVLIDETIANRWSGRAFDSNRAVTQAQTTALLEAARWAPSCFGDQPWRFVVWNNNIDSNAWQQALDCLAPSNQAWAKDAPLLMLVCADTLFSHNQQANRWAQYDTGAAAENLCLQASSMGLMAHQMGGFNADLAREKFNIPVQFTLMAMISVGYQEVLANLDGDTLARETAPRKRRAFNDLFFSGRWNEPIE